MYPACRSRVVKTPVATLFLAALAFAPSQALAQDPATLPVPVPAVSSGPADPALAPTPAAAPMPAAAPEPAPEPAKPEKSWFERIHIRGYTQIRYNRLPSFDVNENIINDQGDKSIGGDGGFFIRRARVILFGDMNEHVSIYLQPDFASSISEQQHVAILRDWYADIHLDKAKEFRFRVGQSKVPYGFENMQSSSNRLPFDRADPLNSAVKDERDLGVFFYWAPAHIRDRFKQLQNAKFKGSGDYGVFALGAYNGQTANRVEGNDRPHVVARLTWPFKIAEQFVEVGVQAYTGKYNLRLAQPTGMGPRYAFVDSTESTNNLTDQRVAATVVIYPQPFGFVAEGTLGRGPQAGRADPYAIDVRDLQGGYLQAMYRFEPGQQVIFPYVRAQYYRGGKKFENNAPAYKVKELEAGVEWQASKWLELTGAYTITDRTSSKTLKQEEGHLVRLQLQFNY